MAIGPVAKAVPKNPIYLPNMVWDYPMDERSGTSWRNRIYTQAPYPATNLLTFPENTFNSTGGWSPSAGITGTASADTSPDGENNGYRINCSGACTLSRTVSLPAGTYTLSVYARNYSGSDQTLQFRYTAGTSPTQNLTTTPSWTRVSWTFTAGATVTQIRIQTSASGDFSIWGAQLEEGSTATPYVPNRYTARAFSTTPPTFGPDGGTFDGVNDYAQFYGPSLSYTSGAVYLVCRQTAPTNIGALFAAGDSFKQCLIQTGGGGSNTFSYPYTRWWSNSTTFGVRDATYQDVDHVVCIVRDAEAGVTSLYLDACKVATSTDQISVGTENMWFLGRALGGQYYPGIISGLYRYNVKHDYDTVLKVTRKLQAERVAIGKVINPATHMVFFSGDSLSNAVGSATGKGWTKLVMESLSASGYPGIQGCSVAVSGTGVTTTPPATRIAQLTNLYTPPGCKRVITVWFGANDLRNAATATAFVNGMKNFGAALVTAGYRVIVATVLPEVQMDNTVRATANAELRNPAYIGVNWHEVVDLAANAQIGADGQELDTTYFDPDKIHLNDTGYAVAVSLFEPAIRNQLLA